MATKALALRAAVRVERALAADPCFTRPVTTEERLERIRQLGQRIDGYIQFVLHRSEQELASERVSGHTLAEEPP